MNVARTFFGVFVAVVAATMISPAWADPLPGEILKFDQQPMIATPIGGQIYFGHDEWSTAYRTTAGQEAYQGWFMADDFADRFDMPVVHVKWWGSYLRRNERLADKFLIAFETDVPADPTGGFSHPGTPLLTQVVAKVPTGPLVAGSGTFTETLVPGSNPAEPVYEYNAELHCPFPEQRDTVYWLKIVALDDLPYMPNDPLANIYWGWHNRDYTIPDPLASTPPPPLPGVFPGEYLNGTLPSGEPIWHFQDDAVMGDLTAFLTADPCKVEMTQSGYTPMNYVYPSDGPDMIGQYSKDLAFQLYTVPEPSTCVLLGMGLLGLLAMRRKRN